ncbi:uncharacterized protein LOC128233008 [Mya arenaria]|nr:uncharacterized protein LOC128233008 [Mya arenaria]XP_052802819.1 uncharacterized protein LOC128233008 [Mya arenaria]
MPYVRTRTMKMFTQSLNVCSKQCFHYCVSVLMLYVVCGVRACKFPRYLETSAMWMTHNEHGNQNKGYFTDQFMKASRCDGGNCYQYQRKCLSKHSDDKFEVQHTTVKPNSPPMYLCMQILRRSDSIIQIRESSELYYRSPNACSEKHLILDNWPMVTSENFEKQKIACPFSGGYNIRFHSSDNEPKCATEIIPPRLESECEAGDGMTINFQSEACRIPALEMAKVQPIYCAATWTFNNFTFVILRPQSDDFKAWCMRIKGTDMNKKIEHGEIFIDFVCAPGDGSGTIRETSNYLSIEFEQRIISSTCADSYSFCDDRRLCKQEMYSIHCRKFCNYCTGDPSMCSFPGSLQGTWLERFHETEWRLDVEFYSLSMTGRGRFQCHEKDEHDFLNNTMLLQTFNNGCFPRYACLEVRKHAPSILEYRLSNRVGWPIKSWDTLKDDVCDDSMFKPNAEDREMFGKGIEEKPMRNIVDIAFHSKVNCELEDFPLFRDNQVYVHEEDVCDYCLMYNPAHRTTHLGLHPLNCSSPSLSLSQKEYHCLGVFPHDENAHSVITRTMHHHQEYMCWVFIHGDDREERLGTIYVVDATICGSAAVEGLKSGSMEALRTFTVPSQPRSCPYLPEVQTPTLTPRTTTPRAPTSYGSDVPVQSERPTDRRWPDHTWRAGPSSPQTDRLSNRAHGFKPSSNSFLPFTLIYFISNLHCV